jgi:FKBP-type peptidyl-prolyl cis-trans isomerase
MATPKSQRIGILVIAVVMIVGTLGSFLVLILDTQNQQSEDQELQAVYSQYQADSEAYQAKLDAQAQELSDEYYPIFKKFESRPGPYDIDSITELKTVDLTIGNGEKIDGDTPFAAYYIGWNPDGKVFDQSITIDALGSPIPIDGLDQASLIEGWKTGLIGMNMGGVRELSIPSDLAYGETGQGDTIPPNTPLKFIVMAIPQPEPIEPPEIPEELLQ